MQYYTSKKKVSTACDFSGKAQKQATSTTGNCATLIKEAGGIIGTSTVTSTSKASGSSSGERLTAGFLSVGGLRVGAAVAAAFMGGILMVVA